MPELLLALDAGTTSARAMVVAPSGAVLGSSKRPITTRYPAPGHVEQDATEVWNLCLSAIFGALEQAGRQASDIAAVGVTSQRSSVVLWERESGRPTGPIIIWSDLRGMAEYEALRAAGLIAWPQAPSSKLPAAIRLSGLPTHALQWGTLDSWLVNRLSGGAAHVTDASCAWMSGYFDYDRGGGWNEALLAHQNLPETLFAAQVDSYGHIAETDPAVFGARVPVSAVIADQQAGMIAHGAFAHGAWKATYGTSGVLMVGTGDQPLSPHWTMPPQALVFAGGERLFCVEGMVITTGSLLEWLCHPMGLFDSPAAIDRAARSVPDTGGVTVRPSLMGLGAPHARFEAQGLLAGLTLATTPAHIARAALQGIAFRFRDIVEAIGDALPVPDHLPVDGGLTGSEALLQQQADALQLPVRRHAVREGTAYGAALAAGLGAGLIGRSDVAALARYDAEFVPRASRDEADGSYARWRKIVMEAWSS